MIRFPIFFRFSKRGFSALLCSAILTTSTTAGTVKTSAALAYKALIEENYEQAIIAYEAMLSTDSENPDFHFNLGISYFKSFRFSSAQQSFERALLLSIENPDFQAMAIYNIGITMFEQAKLYADLDQPRALDYLKGAIQAFENTIELAPDKVEARTNFAICSSLVETLNDTQKPSAEESEDPSQGNPEKDSPEQDPNAQQKKEMDSQKSEKPPSNAQPQGPGDPATATSKDDPSTTDKVAGTPNSEQLDKQEALMLLDTIEQDEKRITLSQLQESQEKTDYESEANW